MGMYTINEKTDGTWFGRCMIQDGYEYFTRPTREEAIDGMVLHAKIMNHTDITEADMKIYPYQTIEFKPEEKQEVSSIISTLRKLLANP